MFKKFLDRATSEIKNLTTDKISHGLDIATETIISGKDTAQSTLIKNGLNIFIKIFGEIRDLKFDTKTKSIIMSIFLKGETDDVILKILNYKFWKDDDDVHYIEISEISANRYWIDAIANVLLSGKKFAIPQNLVIPIKILM